MAQRNNKKFLLTALGLTMVAGATLWFGFNDPSPASVNSSFKVSNSEIRSNADSDSDGLADWEEQLLGTDIHRPDTDGDGVLDGKEILEERNPIKAGPDDQLPPDFTPIEEGNLTYDLAKNLLESGVLNEIDENGALLSTNFLQNVSLPDSLDTPGILRDVRKVSRNDLTLFDTNDSDVVRKYFEEFSTIEKTHISPHQDRGDVALFVAAMHLNRMDLLQDLDPLIVALDRTIGDLSRLPVPSDYADIAVKEINYLLETKAIVNIFRNTANDPLASLVVFRRRVELLDQMAQSHVQIIDELRSKGIL